MMTLIDAVARMERSEIRERPIKMAMLLPDYATAEERSLHPGYRHGSGDRRCLEAKE
jgi:hypothetical protein